MSKTNQSTEAVDSSEEINRIMLILDVEIAKKLLSKRGSKKRVGDAEEMFDNYYNKHEYINNDCKIIEYGRCRKEFIECKFGQEIYNDMQRIGGYNISELV